MKLRTIPFIGGASYSSKVLGIETANLIAYWPMNEAAGAVADNLEGTAARDGAYTGVTLGQPGIGDGNTCPLFDGANDFNDIYSVSFRDAFNAAEGTLMVWAKPTDWAAGNRFCVGLQVDGTNIIQIDRNTATLRWIHIAGAVTDLVQKAAMAETGWMCLGMTWSAAGDALKAYYNGTQEGVTQATLGVWAGTLHMARTTIGAGTTVPGNPWEGYLAHCAVWTTPLTAPQMAALAVV